MMPALRNVVLLGRSSRPPDTSSAPHLRNPVDGFDTAARGNVNDRNWLNSLTGHVFKFNGTTWADLGGQVSLPGDLSNDWHSIVSVKPLKAAPSSSNCVEVHPVDRAGADDGASVLAFSGGGFPSAAARALQGSSGIAGLAPPESAVVFGKQLWVSQAYDQNGANHYVQATQAGRPVLWCLDGTVEGSGLVEDGIAFSYEGGIQNSLVCSSGALNLQSCTVYVVVNPAEGGNESNFNCGVFSTSTDGNFVSLAPPGTQSFTASAQSPWRIRNASAGIDLPGPKFSCAPTVLSLSMGPSGWEFAANDDIVTSAVALPNATGVGAIIGAAQSGGCFKGQIRAVMVATGTHNAAKTALIRQSLMREFKIVPQMANDLVVRIGPSGNRGYGSVHPLMGYVSSGNKISGTGVDGLNTNHMMHRLTKRRCRTVQLGANNLEWTAWAASHRVSTVRAFYDAPASSKILHIGHAWGGVVMTGGGGTFQVTSDGDTAWNNFVTMLTAFIGAGGSKQNWTVRYAKMPGTGFANLPGTARFYALLEANKASLAATLGVSIDTHWEYDPAQIDGWVSNPLDFWQTGSSIYEGHPTPALYARAAANAAAAIDAVL